MKFEILSFLREKQQNGETKEGFKYEFTLSFDLISFFNVKINIDFYFELRREYVRDIVQCFTPFTILSHI